jgi:hypothetical protein
MPFGTKFQKTIARLSASKKLKELLLILHTWRISAPPPRHLGYFEFSPSIGASGGFITIWNGSMFEGELVLTNSYSVTVKLKSLQSGLSFHVTNIYGPAASSEKVGYITWLYNFDMTKDFNLLWSPENKNRGGGNLSEMNLFNDLIHHLDLVEIAFQGQSYTWSNMQNDPLLEKLD